MKIVPFDQIPTTVEPAPEGNLIELYKTCLRMENLCLENHGAGLSAVQVTIPWKLFVVRMDMPDRHAERRGTKPMWGQTVPTFRYFVNCEYEPLEGSKAYASVEGCLSILDKHGSLRHFNVQRHEHIALKGKELVVQPDLALKDVDEKPEHGWFSTVVQHEVDHQRGILISGIGTELDVW